jgi:HD superfamily phosphohydrolase
MPSETRPQRIRDPIHNLIEFGTDQFEQMLWRVIQTPTFQRLRRIRQLGFSEFVYPGATHTRFAHSIGVFHVARQLVRIIEQRRGVSSAHHREHQADVALAAALVHDIGHGMFSHAMEAIGRKLNLPFYDHEVVGKRLVIETEIAREFEVLGRGFATDVVEAVKDGRPRDLYAAVVSSQFDADRLDYIQRDRLMAGVESSGIDATWLLSNLETYAVRTGTDAEEAGVVETLVLGRKAFHVAESYVLSLFHLYPNVYFHKATRAAEKIFAALVLRLIDLAREGQGDKTALPPRHLLLRFAKAPEDFALCTALDDAVFWGALPMLEEADDLVIAGHARSLLRRQLPKCVDVRRRLEEAVPPVVNAGPEAMKERAARLRALSDTVIERFEAWAADRPPGSTPIYVDQVNRQPYKKRKSTDLQSPLDQILIRLGEGEPLDMADISPVVANAASFEGCRAYVTRGDTASEAMLGNIIRTTVQEERHVGA